MTPTPKYIFIASARADMQDLLGCYQNSSKKWEDGLLVSCMRRGIPLEIRDLENFQDGMTAAIEEISEAGRVVLEQKEDQEVVKAKDGFELTFGTTPERDPNAYRSRGKRPAAANRS